MTKRAIIHVENTEGVLEFAKYLADSGWEILTANKTEELLKNANIPVVREHALVEKNLYVNDTSLLIQKIMTTRYQNDTGLNFQSNMESENLFIVCLNIYPHFTTSAALHSIAEVTHPINFYIATLIRNAFLNYENILILTDPEDYKEAIIQLKTDNITEEFRVYLAAKALALVSSFDGGIASSVLLYSGVNKDFAKYLAFPFKKQATLHSGANPNQKACLYKYLTDYGAISGFQKLQGKELTYNIIIDIALAWEQVSLLYKTLKNQFTVKSTNSDGYNYTTQFTPLTGVVFAIAVKYKNILGASLGSNSKDALIQANNFDYQDIKEAVLGCSAVIDADAAQEIIKFNCVAVVAPGFTDEAKQILSQDKNIRLVPTAKVSTSDYDLQFINGGLLFQNKDDVLFNNLNVKTKGRPSQYITDEMAFGIQLTMGARSYSAVLLKNNSTIGISQGCKSANKAVAQVLEEAKELARRNDILLTDFSNQVLGDLLVCDASITLTEPLKELIKYGLSAIIQTGGEPGDEEFIKYCNEHGVVMVFTGMTHVSF